MISLAQAAYIGISIPLWLAGVGSLFGGTIGTIYADITEADFWASLVLLVVSSILFWVAAKMCGVI